MTHVLVVHSAGDLTWLARLRVAGYRFTLIKKQPTDADRQAFDEVIDHDPQLDTDQTLALVDALHASDPIRGVLSFSESGVIMAAIIAARLQLPGHPPAAALRSRDKVLMRQAMKDAGLHSPSFHRVQTPEEVIAHLRLHKAPMVLKPISGSSSYGVTRLSDSDTAADIETKLGELRRYIADYRRCNPQYPFEFWLPGEGHGIPASDVHNPEIDFLLEGFIAGQQVSVDGFVADGRVTPCGVIEIERIRDPRYFLEYEEWMPSRYSAALEARIQDVASDAVLALGLRNGAFHCELKVEDGECTVVEVAARRGADNIADFLQTVMDVDIYAEAVRIACGEPPVAQHPQPGCHMKMRYFLPDTAGQLVAIEGDGRIAADPRVSELVFECDPGDEILMPPEGFEFLGYVSVRGDSAASAAAALEEVYPRVHFLVLPRQAKAAVDLKVAQ